MKKLPKWLRFIIIGGALLTAFVCIIALIVPGSDDTSQPTEPRATKTPRPTSTPRPTKTVTPTRPTSTPRPTKPPTDTPEPTPTLAPDKLLEQIATNERPGAGEVVEATYYPAGLELGAAFNLTYSVTIVLSDESALENCVYSFLNTAPELYAADASLDVVNFRYETTFVDPRGNETQQAMLKIQILRDTADKINWSNMLRCDVPKVVNAFVVHQALRDTWNGICD